MPAGTARLDPEAGEPPEPLEESAGGADSSLSLDWMQGFQLEGTGPGLRRTAVTGPGFDAALELAAAAGTNGVSALVVTAPVRSSVSAKDVLVLSFHARAVGPGASARVEYRFIHVLDGRKSAQWGARIGSEWRRVEIPFVAQGTQDASASRMEFRVELQGQAFQLAEVHLQNHGQIHPSALAINNSAYPGREPGAAWRAEARERIERLRKGDLEVRVVDSAGAPVSGARVRVRMRRHAFAFGSAVAASQLTANTADAARYRARVEASFNTVVLENDLKWQNWENLSVRSRTLDALAWLRARKIATRGHTLVWGHSSALPPRVKDLLGAPVPDGRALQDAITTHIDEEASALRGQVVDWDVVNEAYSEDAFLRILGAEVLAEWFRSARAADPQVRLFYNDFTILSLGALDPEATDSYARFVESLQSHKAPLDALGEQGHFLDGVLMPPERVWDQLDRFARYGLPIRITELDVNVTDEALQADYLRDFMTACFAHPAVDGILLWGFWQGQHWMPQAGLWRRDWSIKPSGQAWLELVQREWWTDAELTTDAEGRAQVRGFLGEYSVEVASVGRTASVQLTLPRQGRSTRVSLAP